MSNSDMLMSFLEDVTDMLNTWERECLQMEEGKKEPQFDELFRIAHNIKGSAKMVELDEFGAFIHKVEDIINFLRDGKLIFDLSLINFFLDVHSLLNAWVVALADDPHYIPDLSALQSEIAKLHGMTGQSQPEKQTEAEVISPKTENPQKVKELLKEIKKYVPAKEKVIDMAIEENLVISEMKSIMARYNFEDGKKYKIVLAGEEIDTAGVQYLLALKLMSNNEFEFQTEHQAIRSALALLGLEGKLL